MQICTVVENFAEAKARFEAEKAQFEAEKKRFYATMERALTVPGALQSGGGNAVFYVPVATGGEFVVNRIQRCKVQWDAEKAEKALLKKANKETVCKIVQRQTMLTDKEGFIAYAKSLGADPKKVMSFFVTTKKVDEKVLESMTDTGAIAEEWLDGCYTAELQEPYWTVKFKAPKTSGGAAE